MATRGKTRQDRSSLGLERLELEDGQGQGGEQELESKKKGKINCMDNFHHSLSFYVLLYFILVWKRHGRQDYANI